MPGTGKVLGLTLSGGGVKGIAYVGVFSEAESRGYRWGNIAGVSIGALAGAFAGAGYQSVDMWELMQGFGFKSIQLREIARLPVVSEFREFILGVRALMNRPCGGSLSRLFRRTARLFMLKP